ncbi:hypothetical protein CIL05_13435 [Virgibacillus profundi]|uniref:Type VII secretion protein EssB n=1 Tax=Virgibacillus profundi TaxID=2024555 RepID=A0A2A2IC87_9BACI|nr:type VII secretion protein EssB/YukC [Virgibacillus profundi]PAV28978.1 hypothetical protein CIL05_13435 [Virgibacillus profundi]PXY53146.1 hypothetical protein CIT14_13560 [Virgibacillus profundi]
MMEGHYALRHGTIKENDDVIVYEIPKAQTDLVETEQLDELRRKDSFFFDFWRYTVDEKYIHIYYKREKNYKSLKSIPVSNNGLKQKIATNLLIVEKLIGTQYTTIIHPDNIYVNEKGDVKFAHRGIRSVLPTEELTSPQLVKELKPILKSLFMASNFADAEKNDKNNSRDIFINEINSAATIKQLREIVNNPNLFHHKTTVPTQKPKQSENPKRKYLLPAGFLIGVALGMILLYMIKVVPLTEASTEATGQQNEKQEVLTNENKELQSMLDDNRKMMHAYRSAVIGDSEEAISIFEDVENLDESAKRTLIEQYINLNTVESLKKAGKMSEAYHVKVVEGLRGINSEEAGQAILQISSDDPVVKIEQAWINGEHKNVIELSKGIAENNRAKFLAAKSYIELDNHQEAMKLGKELENKDIQVASLEVQKNKINANDDMEDDEKEEAIKKLDEEIKNIKG